MMNRRLFRGALSSLVPALLSLQIGLSAGSATAQDSHTAALIERAKKEASLVWYTSTSIEDAKSLLDTFNKKYPSIKTEFFNAGSARVFNRILNEARAGKIFFDLVCLLLLDKNENKMLRSSVTAVVVVSILVLIGK